MVTVERLDLQASTIATVEQEREPGSDDVLEGARLPVQVGTEVEAPDCRNLCT